MTQTHETTVQNAIQKFQELDQKMEHYAEILGLVNWDMQTGAPRKGKALRSEAIGTLSAELFQLSISDEMAHCLNLLSDSTVADQLDVITQARVRERKRDLDKTKKIPADEYKQFIVLTSNAHDSWEEAKKQDDFSIFEPDLEKIVDFQRKFIDYYGYNGHPYNALLDNYEPGLTVETIDAVFTQLRQSTVELLHKIKNATFQPKTDIFDHPCAVEKQKEFSLFVLPQLGYDLEAGRLDESAHSFATGLNTGDVRITTHYQENNMRSAIFGTLHECGHALYEQGINPDYEGTVLCSGTSMGIHESQSRFIENMVGRSTEFWTFFYDDLQRYFPEPFKEISLDDFTRAINTVQPSPIRVEADELTYNLHIMIRYEIEKALMAGEIEVKDLPTIWNQKMEEYLGIKPKNNTEGVLQDIHWAMGGFGYFPSYTLGNIYSAQFLHAIKQDMPEFYTNMTHGEFLPIREWLKENIHRFGKSLTPHELLQKVTGEQLNATYLINYLNEKFSSVYKLDKQHV